MIMPLEIKGVTYLDTTETTQKLGVSRVTLNAMVKDGRIAQYKQGVRRIPYYKLADVERLLEMRQQGSDDSNS